LKSIIREIGTDAFTRLRVGIDRPSIPARAYVLQPFTREQEAVLPALVDVTCDAIEAILARGPTAAMNEFNRDWLPALR
jgi:peptidyl-tRNA hydrolase, PTH1 family